MSTLSQLVALLYLLVGFTVVGGLVYLSHRHPASREPLVIGLTGVAVLASLVTSIVTRG
ncbi:hypothetical protein [Streptomyces canus]|uniref:hypothetical protein n=1 Tax=Streptomyces canus TaxID=58343 RepID=UPI002E27B841|nr:hypothetical protein [Streptomyces canus]